MKVLIFVLGLILHMGFAYAQADIASGFTIDNFVDSIQPGLSKAAMTRIRS
jgi:hypothetical protein